MKTDDPWDRAENPIIDHDRDEHPARRSGSAPIVLILLGIFVFVVLLIWGGIELTSHLLNTIP